MTTTRRGFLASALGFLAAPPIVRATSIMPVSAVPLEFTAREVPTFFDPRGYFGSFPTAYEDCDYQWLHLPQRDSTATQILTRESMQLGGRFRVRRWDGNPITLT